MSDARIDGPGRKVSTGHLRVDTARAVKKLREYQLAQPETWVLEVLRAAVALDATRLFVSGDAGDVVVGWDGGLLDDATMVTVLDELVNPGAGRHDGAIRRLATGLNTALGPTRVFGGHTLPPRHVDLERTDADGSRRRVRYTSELLEAEPTREDQPGLQTLVAEPLSPAPAGAVAGMLVHLERQTLHTFVRFLGRAEPDELRVVRECADDVPVPLHIASDVLHIDDSSFDLLRVPLGEGLRGFVALVDADSIAAGTQPAWVDLAEGGIILARQPLKLGAAWEQPKSSVPIRAFLDRQSLPTNASRSAVRMDSALEAALDVAAQRVPVLLEELHRVLLGPSTDAPVANDALTAASEPNHRGLTAQARHHRLRKSALQLIAAHVRGHSWRFRSKSMPAELQPLMKLPLLRDALGQARSVAHFGETTRSVYRGTTILSAERYGTAPERMCFVPLGDAAERLLTEADYETAHVTQALAEAESAGRAKARFLEAALTSASIPATDEGAWVVVPLSATRASSLVQHLRAPGADIVGELALYASRGSPRGRVTLLHEGRPIAELLLPASASYYAVVACPRLTPQADYRDVRDDAVREEVIASVERALVIAAEVAARLERGEASDVEGARLLRAAPPAGPLPRDHVQALMGVALSLLEPADGSYARSPLAQAKLLTVRDTSGTPQRESIADAVERARLARAWLYCSDEGAAREALGKPGAHPVSLLSEAWVQPLAALAGVPAARVDATVATTTRFASLQAEVVLRVEREDFVAEVGWGGADERWTVFRNGSVVEAVTVSGRLLPVQVHIDHRQVVVDARSQQVVLRPDYQAVLYELEEALLDALLAAARGARPAALRVLREAEVARQLTHVMAQAPGPLRKQFGAALQWLESNLTIPTARGSQVSLAALKQQKGVWSLEPGVRVTFDHPGFNPVSVDRAWQRWLEVVLGSKLRDGNAALPEFERQAGGQARRERVLAQRALPMPTVSVDDVFALRVARPDATGVLRAATSTPPWLRLTVAGRLLAEIATPGELPLTGQLDVPESAVDASWDALSPTGAASLDALLHEQLAALLVQLAGEHPLELVSEVGQQLVRAWATSPQGGKNDARTRQALMHAPAWHSVQGEAVSILGAKRRSRIQCAVFDGGWLGTGRGERKTAYDHPVIAVAAPAPESTLARYVAWLDAGAVGDLSLAVQQLQARRRVEQGRSERPSLGRPDALSIAVLCKDDPRLWTSLGPGEARLELNSEGSKPSSVRLYVDGRVATTCVLPVFPPVEVALEASGYMDPTNPERVDTKQLRVLTQRVQALASLLVTRAFATDASRALRDATRNAWLTLGLLEDDHAQALPVLATTANTWTSLDDVTRAAAESGHAQWYTSDTRCDVVPEDASRCALRLTDPEARALRPRVTLEDVTEALALQPARLANQARPKATSLDARLVLTTLGRSAETSTLAYAEFEPDGKNTSRGSLVLLTPNAASAAGLHVFRALHPLGVQPCRLTWPALIVVDDESLTPNARYDAPVDDARFQDLLARAASVTEAALTARFDPGEQLGACAVDITLPSGTQARGRVQLGDPLDVGQLTVGDRGQVLRELPLRGELWLCLAADAAQRGAVGAEETRAMAELAYEQLIRDLADALVDAKPKPSHAPFVRHAARWSAAERDFATAHVLRATLRGHLSRKHRVHQQLTLSCFVEPLTLEQACGLVTGRVAVRVVGADEAVALPDGTPGLRLDDSWVARALAEVLDPEQGGSFGTASALDAASDPRAGSEAARSAQQPLRLLTDELSALLALAFDQAKRVPPKLVVSPRRERPLITLEPGGQVVVLAGGSGRLAGIDAALAGGTRAGHQATVALGSHLLVLVNGQGPPDRHMDTVAALEAWAAERSEDAGM